MWKCIHGTVLAYLQKLCIPMEMSNIVNDHGLHQLRVSSCQEWRQHSYTFYEPKVRKSAFCSARQQPITEHVKQMLKCIHSNADRHEYHLALKWHILVTLTSVLCLLTQNCKVVQTTTELQRSEQNSQLSECFQQNFVISISVQFVQDCIDDNINTIQVRRPRLYCFI